MSEVTQTPEADKGRSPTAEEWAVIARQEAHYMLANALRNQHATIKELAAIDVFDEDPVPLTEAQRFSIWEVCFSLEILHEELIAHCDERLAAA